LSNSDWKVIGDMMEKKLNSWKGHLALINSVLTSIMMFLLSFIEVAKGVHEKIEYYRSRFFWQSGNQKKKYRLTKWSIISQPKDQGG
jgi:hypothetical protein